MRKLFILEETKYLVKCGACVLCFFLIILEINSDELMKYGPKKHYITVSMHQREISKSRYRIILMSDHLWEYLREGLNYLETGGKSCPPAFTHSGGKAFGPLGLTQAAIEDVVARSAELSRFNTAEVLSDTEIYENFAKAYADILLRHYLKINYWVLPFEQVFDILQQAWFLGPGLYKNGGQVIFSRHKRAYEYKIHASQSL